MDSYTGSLLQVNSPVATNHEWQELQHFAGLGRLSASLLHEISNPLTAASLHLEQYTNQAAPSIRHARRSIELMRRYVEAARQQVRHESIATSFNLCSELNQVKQLLTPLARSSGVRLDIWAPANCRLFGDPVKLQQIIANLATNAIHAYRDTPALSSGNKRRVTVTVVQRQPWVIIEVVDRAMGVTPTELPELFRPFYTTKQNSGGLGIGLAIVKQYVETDFHGSIDVTSSPQAGTRFRVKLRSNVTCSVKNRKKQPVFVKPTNDAEPHMH